MHCTVMALVMVAKLQHAGLQQSALILQNAFQLCLQ